MDIRQRRRHRGDTQMDMAKKPLPPQDSPSAPIQLPVNNKGAD